MAESTATSSTNNSKSSSASSDQQLVVVDIGKRQRRKRVKQLRKGKGKLLGKVQDVVTQLREEGVIGDNAQPVVIVVREKDGPYGRMPW